MREEKWKIKMITEIISLGISVQEAKELIKESKNIKKDIKLLKKGYPIQYLIGHVNFYGNKILVNKSVLIPRYTTETLIEKTFEYTKKLNKKTLKILDLCTGSGCVAISIKKLIPSAEVYASDISKKALKVCKKNAFLNNVEIKTIKSNLFKKIKNHKFDVIISNPPYVSNQEKLSKTVKYEPKKALFSQENGTKHIKKILQDINKYTNKKHIVGIEMNSYTKNAFDNKKYIFEKDLENKNRYLFIINV